jgi:hypothetical protein
MSPDRFQVDVEQFPGPPLLEVQVTSSIGDIKQQLATETGIPPDEQLL